MRKERHRVFQVARPRLAEAQSADVQFVDDQVRDVARHGESRRELVRPEVLLGDADRWLPRRRRQVARHRVQAHDEAAALGAVEAARVAVPVAAAGILRAAPDLLAREDVRAIDDSPLGVGDAIHVRQALVGGKVRDHCRLPDSVRAHGHGQGRASGVDPGAVVGDVAVGRIAEHHLHPLRVGRPHGEAQPGGSGTAVPEDLPRAEPAGIGEVVLLDLGLAASGQQLEHAHAVGAVRVVDLGRDARDVGDRRRAEPHDPLERPADLASVKAHRRGEPGAPVRGRDVGHRRLRPVRRGAPGRVPAPDEPRVVEDLPLEPRQISELHGYGRHDVLLVVRSEPEHAAGHGPTPTPTILAFLDHVEQPRPDLGGRTRSRGRPARTVGDARSVNSRTRVPRPTLALTLSLSPSGGEGIGTALSLPLRGRGSG